MKRLEQLFIQQKLIPKVLHRIPGRLRLHLALLKDMHSKQSKLLIRLIQLPSGIEKTSTDLRTGNLLIRYNPEQITEDEILNFFKVLAKIAGRYWQQLANASDKGHLDRVFNRLKPILQQAILSRQVLDKNIIIPENVWEEI